MHILLFSEIDPIHSERNRLHWIVEALAEEHQVTVVGMRDTTKTMVKQPLTGITVHLLNDAPESPAKVDAFPGKYFKKLETLVDLSTVDLVFSYNGLRFSTCLAKKMRHVPFVYDLCDDLAHLVAESSYIPAPLGLGASAVAAYYVRANCRAAKRITTTHPLLPQRYGAAPKKILHLPNGYFWKKPQGTPPVLLVKQPGEVWVVFVGALREWVDLESVIRETTAWPVGWKLMIVGEEGRLGALKKAAEPYDDRVHFTGHMPHHWLPEFLQHADVGLIPFKKNTTTDMAVTLKLLEYASCGVPIVTTDLLLTREMFGHFVHIKGTQDTWQQHIEKALKDDRSDLPSKVATYHWPLILKNLLDDISTLRPDL